MNIGIIGLGLLGGSLAKAFKDANAPNSYIIAADTCLDTLQKARKEGIIDHCAGGIDASFSTCAVIFICTPVAHIPTVVGTLLLFISKDCIITDVGSTKYEIIQQVQKVLDEKKSSAYFIGGHPMAGSEESGYNYSKAHLFQNAYYIITPAGDTPDFILTRTRMISLLKYWILLIYLKKVSGTYWRYSYCYISILSRFRNRLY